MPANYYKMTLQLNMRTDADLVAFLESVPNKTGLIKGALREMLRRQREEKEARNG